MARGSKAWLNGQIVPTEQTNISIFSHALHYGFGCFEGIRAYKQKRGGGAVFRLKEHMDRLLDSSNILGLKLKFSSGQLCDAAVATCKANSFEECYIRPIVFVGDGPLGVDPGADPPVQVAILNWEWGAYLGDSVTKGARMKISSYIRPHPNSTMTKGKITGQYVTGVLGKREAVSQGFDEALFLDPQGYLSEGSGENLFMVTQGVVKTTPLTSILGGITRRTVIEHLRAQKIEVQEQLFTRDELLTADEVFLTGTAAEITPVREIDNRPIGRGDNQGKPGPLTRRLQSQYADIVRGDLPSYGREWLTPIR